MKTYHSSFMPRRHAVDDQVVPFALAGQLPAGIPGSKLVPFDTGGHGLFYAERRKVDDELMRCIG